MGSTPGTETELRTRVRQQEVVTEFGQQALETDDLDQLMHDASVAVAETLDNEYCKVLELLPGGDEVFLRQGVGWQDGLVGNATVPTDLDSQAGYTLISREPIIVDDLRTEDRFSGPDLLVDHDVISGISVIIGSVEEPWGVLGTHTTDRQEFTEYDANFVQSVANVLASAIETKQAKRRLEEEKALKDQIVETSPVGIVVFGADGGIQFANEHAEKILGRSREEIELVTHDDPRWGLTDANGKPLSGEETPFMRVVATGEPIFDMEVGLRRPDGERIWLTVNGAPLETEVDGSATTGAVFALTDVTEQKRLESEFEEMLGRITDAFYAVNDKFQFTHVNERATELLQRPEEELLGETLWELYPEAAEVDEVWDAFHTALDDQESTSYELYFDPLDFWVEANLYPSETGVSVYFRDVTERKERERDLERTLDLLEKTERIADVGGWEIDADTMDVFWTDHFFELLEVSSNEPPSLDEGLDMYHEDDQPIVKGAIENALDSGDPFDVEARRRTAGGKVCWLRLQAVPEAVDGEVVSLRGAAQDITEHKNRERALEQANERLKVSNQRLEQFAYATSHDLQEPLRMVSSYLRLLEQRYDDALDEEGVEFLEFAVNGADRMRNMIDGLLTYSRVETQGDPFEPIDLDAVFEDVLDDLEFQIEKSDADITADSLPRVRGDRAQIRQVFQNLLDNAITYSGNEPPQIHVSAERDDSEWVVSVRDEGIGLDPTEASRVFEVFQRLHSREEYSGSGIGLALCQRIIERHGGEIWVDSEPSEGSTFSFTLPVADT